MTFSESLALVAGLLILERRVSYRRLRNEFALDEQTLADVRHELVVAKGLARDENGEVLVCTLSAFPLPAGDEVSTAHRPAANRAVDAALPPAISREAGGGMSCAPSDAARRQLTVMFCDLVDSTALSTRVDPEELRDVIRGFHDVCEGVLRQYDAFVARYMGDGMLVYFGYPRAHEDDAQRAVRAGLGIIEAVTSRAPKLSANVEVEMAVRIGIATGPVVVGDIIGEGAAEEAAVVGETPNLAARLRGVAAPNQVAISPMVQRLVGELFELEDLGRHRLKGMAEPVRVWRVLRERDTHTRFEARRGVDRPPMVGREEELGLLLRAWETSREGHGQVVLVQGEAGIGKSRLLEAIHERVTGQDYQWAEIHCSPYHSNSALYPVVEHLKRTLHWTAESTTEEKLHTLERAIATQGGRLEELVPIYADLLSLPLPESRYRPIALSPRQQREATLDAVVSWLLDEAERNTVLLVWEDLHWADPTTLELLGLCMEQSPTVPMLNVLTYRPEFVPPWSMRTHMNPITLNRMERPEVEALIRLHTRGKGVPSDVTQYIVEKADGVPLFVEELTKTILESDHLHEGSDEYVLEGPLAEISIPATLQDTLMARLDRTPQAREIAQLGAVLGREFGYDMLRWLAPMDEAALQSGLQQLVADELLYQRGRPPRARYIFKHALIQDSAYQSLLKRTLQEYHLQVGRLLESRFPEIVKGSPELLAHHYTNAGVALKAIAAWHAAAERARSRGANQEAVMHLRHGLAVARGLPGGEERARQELKLHFSLGGVYLQMKGHWADEVEAAFARARELCEQVGDAPELVPTLFGLWRTHVVQMVDIERPFGIGDQLLQLTVEDKSPVSSVVAHYAVGFTKLVKGDFIDAREHLKQGMALYRPSDREVAEVYRFGQDPGVACHCYLALAEWALGYPDRGLDLVKQGVALAERLEDPFSKAFANAIGALVDEARRDFEATLVRSSEAVHLSTEKGYPYWRSIGEVMRAWAKASKGGANSAVEVFREQIREHRGLGTDLFAGCFLTLLAEVALAHNQVDTCKAALEEAELLLKRTGERWWESETVRVRGEMTRNDDGGPGEAERLFKKAIAMAGDKEARSLELRAALSLARLWQAQGKRAEVSELLEPLCNWFEEGFETTDLTWAAAMLRASELGAPVTASENRSTSAAR